MVEIGGSENDPGFRPIDVKQAVRNKEHAMNDVKNTIIETIRSYLPEALEQRRDFHRHPERSFQEERTCAVIREKLSAWGVELVPCEMPTAVAGRIRGCGEGPTIMVREDIDALPVTEESGLPFPSENEGTMHACGHDIHTASLLLLARALMDHKNEFKGTVQLLFQPGEETGMGANRMLQQGFGRGDTAYDEIIGFHVSPEDDAGTITIHKGAGNSSFDSIRITVSSKGGHGAYPHLCADPVVAAAYMLTQLQTVISRFNPAIQPAVLTFGSIHGGSAPNIIPTDVTITGTLRAFNEEGRQNMLSVIRRIGEDCCHAMGAGFSMELIGGLPVLVNDADICDRVAAAARAVLGPDAFHECDPVPSSDDFSYFLANAPGAQFRVGSGNELPQSRFGLHNPKIIFDESALFNGTAVLARYLMDKLAD